MNDRSPGPSPFALQDAARRRRRRRWLLAAGLGLALFGLVTAELFARMVLGLGDPPLYQTHTTIEYMPQPSRTYTRFGNRISINRYSMRSPDFEPTKTSDEFRVLVLGDSVPFGGSRVDDTSLATSHLDALLRERLKKNVVVANVSAGSWGPPNMLAYLREFGTFDADVVVMLLNGDDASDVPLFAPLSAEMPTRTPTLALEEVAGRYLPRYLAALTGGDAPLPPAMNADDVALATQAVRQMTTMIRERNAKPVGVLYWRRSEIQGEPRGGLATLRGEFEQLHVPIVESREEFRAELDIGAAVFADDIHPTTLGQTLLGNVLLRAVEQVIDMPPLPGLPPIEEPESPMKVDPEDLIDGPVESSTDGESEAPVVPGATPGYSGVAGS